MLVKTIELWTPGNAYKMEYELIKDGTVVKSGGPPEAKVGGGGPTSEQRNDKWVCQLNFDNAVEANFFRFRTYDSEQGAPRQYVRLIDVDGNIVRAGVTKTPNDQWSGWQSVDLRAPLEKPVVQAGLGVVGVAVATGIVGRWLEWW